MKLKVFVAGPTGTTGRAVVRELLNRGHSVTGFSKNPQSWGTHENYTPVSGTVLEDLPALVKAIEGHEIVISCFAPSHKAKDTYIGLVEGAWHLIVATKHAKGVKPYFIYVGGAGSLKNPLTGIQCIDEPESTSAKYLFEGPIEHLNWLRYVIGIPPFHIYYYLREYGHSNRWFSSLPRLFTAYFENMARTVFSKERSMPHACRAALFFFEGDETFDWTFISPPWFYREGPKTGVYGVEIDYQPVDKKGRWLGINSGDIAVAIVDEAERKDKKWIHWSAYGKQEDTAYYYDDYEGVTFSVPDLKLASCS